MSNYQRLAVHTSHYMVSQISAMIAGLISVPIMTRILIKEDYGRLGLILLGVSFFVSFARLGIPQSITRHLPEYNKAGPESASHYISSVFLFSLVSSGCLMLVISALSLVAKYTIWSDWAVYVQFFGILLFNEVLLSTLSEVYRAQQRSLITSAIGIVTRYSTLAVSLLFFFLVSRSLAAFLSGKATIQTLLIIGFVTPLFRWKYIRFQKVDFGIVKQAIRYGFPLSLATAGGFFIAYGDRYAIQLLLNAVEVARYSLPYDILLQVETALTTPLRMAIIPMVFTMMVNNRSEEASAFLSQIIRGVQLCVIPMILGISWLGKDIVIFLGSSKYADSAPLMPILAIGILGPCINFLITTGLSFEKRTDIIAYLTIGSGVLNILMNLALIPFFGVFGSAWATLATNFILIIVNYRLSSRYLRIRFYPVSLLKAAIAGLLMVGGLQIVDSFLPTGGLGLFMKIPLGAMVYAAIICLIDRDVRRFAVRTFNRVPLLLGKSA